MPEQTPISAAEGRARINSGARAIDVRSEGGRAQAGGIIGAEALPKDAVEHFAAITDPNEELVVFCGTTAGSGPVVDYLHAQGFTNVVHVEGGFDALKQSGLPVEHITAQ